MTPQEFVKYIATDWVESSQDKKIVQLNDYIRLAKLILKEQENNLAFGEG